MQTLPSSVNPFALMLDPQAVLAQIEHSERLERLSRRIWERGSSIAAVRARKVRSHSIPVRFSTSLTRNTFIGSTTSIENGPIRVSVRSYGIRREA